ncbi:MAG: hypothetical protein C4520_03480 [Candidatus Abyssobacteria bacterium SURF_5]|uniref:Uncharacterized protein n=1 Tax=Abyssobacteria bacterium (strain SURF_5) TaxID=2093360 RepID=A0A3A4P9Z6_ABYX5|nr:MAG: hypothetical protein C4520_03480 [Candidatus Abyssubacteria bacterium SURF_5]
MKRKYLKQEVTEETEGEIFPFLPKVFSSAEDCANKFAPTVGTHLPVERISAGRAEFIRPVFQEESNHQGAKTQSSLFLCRLCVLAIRFSPPLPPV